MRILRPSIINTYNKEEHMANYRSHKVQNWTNIYIYIYNISIILFLSLLGQNHRSPAAADELTSAHREETHVQ